MQPARRNPGPHRPGLQPEPDELGKRYDPVLPTGKRGDRGLASTRVDDSGIYMSVNRPLASHGRIVAPSASRFSTRV